MKEIYDVRIELPESIYKRGQIQAVKDETTLEDLMFVLLENYLDDWEPNRDFVQRKEK